MERKEAVTMKGNPLTLVGPELKPGDKAPAFTASAQDLSPVTLDSFKGKKKVFSVTPSLDTPVCDMQLRKFNQDIATMDNVEVINVSMDLPFAIKRFCTTAGVENAVAVSDYKDASFGEAYGVLIKELRLLARAVFIVDENDTVVYAEYVPEATDHPNYDAVVAALK
ncbi:thiol peroxidase [Limisalsivibrio acetivorans]|uniref:thiol peroxidase n=1 Tax=Limisalsivibrio acetivorans TaxID=1304888 RepID=UPI0003B35A6B|nr:thiol peroxidase [Limisalsivibrio acetivorans]